MPLPQDILNSLLGQLRNSAQPRPDLITPGSTGVLENARPVTYLGRMVLPGESPERVLQRFPQGETESGGMTMQASDLLKAAIPAAFWKRAPAELKASLTYALNEQPELMRRALAIHTKILPDLEMRPGNLGSSEYLTPTTHAVRMQPPPKLTSFEIIQGGLPNVREDVLAGTGTHELTHALQYPRVIAAQPEDAATIGKMLNEIISEKDPWLNRASLTRVNRTLDALVPTTIGTDKLAPGAPTALAPTRYGGLAGPRMTTQDAFSRLVMDEGLATLAESARDPRADPMIKLLAERLGLGIVQKGKTPKNWPEALTRGGYKPIE